MHAWHPLLVHLPLGFLVGGVVVDLAGWLGRRPSLRRAGFVLLASGVLLATPAVATGFVAYGRVDHSDAAHAMMRAHRNLMLAGVGLFAAAVVWRWRAGERLLADRLQAGLHGLVLVAAAATLVMGADRGAQLVFGHGTGISSERLERILRDRSGPAFRAPGNTDVREGAVTDSASTSDRARRHDTEPHEH
jgi:uncharacterized membrane protein